MSQATLVTLPEFQQVEAVKPEKQQHQSVLIEVDPHRMLANDRRCDVVSWFKIIEPLAKKAADELKEDMKAQGCKTATGDVGLAELRVSKASNVVDPLKFYNLCRERGVAVADIMGCITITSTKAENLLSKNDLASISVPGKTPEPSLVCAIPKGEQKPSATEAAMLLSQHFSVMEKEPPVSMRLVPHVNE